MKQLKGKNRIEKVTLRMLVEETTSQARHNEILQMFRKLDTDSDGVLTK